VPEKLSEKLPGKWSETLPLLYSFRRCPYAMRARLALSYSGVRVTLREVLLADKPEEMLAISAKGTVPVLQLADGTVIDESYDVLRWALQKNDPDGWLPADLATLDALVERTDHDFKQALDGYKYPEWHTEKTGAEYRAAGEVFLQELEDSLQDSAYLHGAAPGAADIAVMPFIRQFVAVDRDWFDSSPYPRLRRWLDDWLATPLFTSIMEKYPQWRRGDAGNAFPPA